MNRSIKMPMPLATCLLVLGAGLASSAFAANVPNTPLSWATPSFAKNSESIEVLTLRGATADGHSTFIRWSFANAGFKNGALDVTFQQRTAKGTLYATQKFARGQYRVASDKLRIDAGGNRLEVVDGKLLMTFAMGSVTATVTVTSDHPALVVNDRGEGGFMTRRMPVPFGTMVMQAKTSTGLEAHLNAGVFLIHDASNIKAHRIYERSVQLHEVRGARMRIVDYITGPGARANRPLGFVAMRGGGSFAGVIQTEERGNEKLDSGNGYRVPYLIKVVAQRAARTATVILMASRQVKKHDDLGGLSWVKRKAVALWMHPFTYTMAAGISATIKTATDAATPPAPAGQAVKKRRRPVVIEATGTFKYAQVRK